MLNKELAVLLGWTNIVEADATLLGMPPEGIDSIRGQALVPDWVNSWDACGPFISLYRLDTTFSIAQISVHYSSKVNLERKRTHNVYREGIDKDALLRTTIVEAVIAILTEIKEHAENKNN
jgi:hypothetical protein